jgi:hypothetical protein
LPFNASKEGGFFIALKLVSQSTFGVVACKPSILILLGIIHSKDHPIKFIVKGGSFKGDLIEGFLKVGVNDLEWGDGKTHTLQDAEAFCEGGVCIADEVVGEELDTEVGV